MLVQVVSLVIFLLVVSQNVLATNSLRFLGTPTNDDHRVKIQVDDPDPTNVDPGPPADIGAEDFTLEFWMKAEPGNDSDGSNSICGAGWGSWIYGNIIIDRDRFNQGRSYGVSIVNGILRFGLDNGTQTAHTICGSRNVIDGKWYHIVIQRRISDGWMWLYVDGKLDAEADGPDGDISYPDDGVPGNYCRGGLCNFSDPYLVIGAEKHDADVTAYPSYFGFIDELRLSNTLRYSTTPFTVPTQAFITDSNTKALYHFNEGSGNIVNDTSGATGGPSNGEIRPGVVWVTETPFANNGGQLPGNIGLTINTDSVGEADSVYNFIVSRSGGLGAVTVEYVIGDTGSTATSGSDYQSDRGTLSWQDGDTNSQTLAINILEDSDPESAETVLVTLRNPTGGASLSNIFNATLTILDNDIPGTIQLIVSSVNISEAGGRYSLTVTRSGGAGNVSVNYAIVDGTAILNSDYSVTAQAVTGTLSWNDGDTTNRTLEIDILEDSLTEDNETISIALSDTTGGASLGTSAAILMIVDNDASSTVSTGGSGGGGPGSIVGLLLAILALKRFKAHPGLTIFLFTL